MNQRFKYIKKVVKKKRENFLYIFIGVNRTGKSTTMRRQIIVWKKANPGKLVFGFDPQRNFLDLIDVFITPEDENWAVKMSDHRDCLLIIDDFRKLSDSPRPPEGFALLMYDRCDYNMDIMASFHNPSEVINCISDYGTHYFLFFTHTKEGKFKEKIPHYRKCMIASYEINKYVRKNGKGTYPLFPYMFINCEQGKIMGINMINQIKKVT